MVNLLEKLNYTRTALIQGKEAEGREEGKEMSANSRRCLLCATNDFRVRRSRRLFYLKRNARVRAENCEAR